MRGLRRKRPAGSDRGRSLDCAGRDILGSSQSRRAIAPKILLLLPILLRQKRVIMMRRFLVLVLAMLGLSCALNAQVTDTTVCDVVKSPAPFNGKMVRIKGTVVAGFDEFAIKDAADSNCGFPVNAIWLAYPQGSKGKAGPTAQQVSCVTTDPANGNPELAQLDKPAGMSKEQSGTDLQPHPGAGEGQTVSDAPVIAMPVNYVKFTSQAELGHYLQKQYHIRTANELSSCEVCHR